MPTSCAIGANADAHDIGKKMRAALLFMLFALGACRDHKRLNNFDAKPGENTTAPYNGVPVGEQKK